MPLPGEPVLPVNASPDAPPLASLGGRGGTQVQHGAPAAQLGGLGSFSWGVAVPRVRVRTARHDLVVKHQRLHSAGQLLRGGHRSESLSDGGGMPQDAMHRE